MKVTPTARRRQLQALVRRRALPRCSSAPRARQRTEPARLGALLLGSRGVEGRRRAPRAWRTWAGGARGAEARPCVSALGAPANTVQRISNERMLAEGER